MKKLIEGDKRVSKATIRKAVAAVILIILFFISFKVSLPFPEVNTFIKVGTVAGLIYILATFRDDE